MAQILGEPYFEAGDIVVETTKERFIEYLRNMLKLENIDVIVNEKGVYIKLDIEKYGIKYEVKGDKIIFKIISRAER